MDLIGAGLTPLEGGYSGETFLADAAGEQSVVRIYGERSSWRGPHAVDVDAALLRLTRGLLPVAQVREVRRPAPESGLPALLVTSRLPGERLDLVLASGSTELTREIARNLGVVLARLGQVPFLQAGLFTDGQLLVEPMPAGANDLDDWVNTHLRDTALESWSPADQAGLVAVAGAAQDLLDDVDRVCLVHSDFNPKNLLVDPASGEVTGVVDWEFAHSGSPYTDLGNLLRFERSPDFVAAVLESYVDRAPAVPANVVDLARSADLWALVELASRRDANPVAGRAHDQLLAIARTRDLHAQP